MMTYFMIGKKKWKETFVMLAVYLRYIDALRECYYLLVTAQTTFLIQTTLHYLRLLLLGSLFVHKKIEFSGNIWNTPNQSL